MSSVDPNLSLNNLNGSRQQMLDEAREMIDKMRRIANQGDGASSVASSSIDSKSTSPFINASSSSCVITISIKTVK